MSTASKRKKTTKARSVSSNNTFPVYIHIVLKTTILVVGMSTTLLLLVYLGFAFHVEWAEAKTERTVQEHLYNELSTVPEMSLEGFVPENGESFVTVRMESGSMISFWYGLDRIPRIEQISGLNTSFECFYTDETGDRVEYAYDQPLSLHPGSGFKTWFQFEVTSLGDLVERYDNLVTEVRQLPQNPPLRELRDSTGTYFVRENPDPEYVLRNQIGQKVIECDLFTKP